MFYVSIIHFYLSEDNDDKFFNKIPILIENNLK